jgi:hypothetical protein
MEERGGEAWREVLVVVSLGRQFSAAKCSERGIVEEGSGA